MTLQMHMVTTVILPESSTDPNAEPSGGIGWKTTMRVFDGEAQDEEGETKR